MRLLLAHRHGLATQRDALAQLPELRQLQLILKLGLAGQYDLQQFLGRSLQIGQQTDLFQHRKSEILCFVNDQHRGLARPVSLQQPVIQFQQLLAFRTVFASNFKFRQDKIKQLARVHPGIEQKRGFRSPQVQPVQQPVHQRGLPGPDLSGQRDESLAGLYSVHQPGQRFLYLFRQKQIPRIRVNVERVFFQPKEAFVHDLVVVSVDYSLVLYRILPAPFSATPAAASAS